jgi:Ca-activated chloride channel family protein
MRFEVPIALLGLVVVPIVVAIYAGSMRRRRLAVAAFASPAMLPAIAPTTPGWRRHLVPALVLASVVVLLLAAARPEALATVPRERATVMIAIDASRSMEATDIAPTRLGAAKAAITRFLADLPGQFRVGSVAFARTARVLSPPTHDRQAIVQSLAALRPSQGTVVGDGLMESIRALRADWADAGRAPAVVLLLSDGNDTGSDVAPLDAAYTADRFGVRVYAVSLGDANAPAGVTPRPPNVPMLRSIARVAHGRFYSAATWRDLNDVWEKLGSRVASTIAYRDLTFAFVAVALVIAGAAAVAGVRLFRRVP